MFLHKSKRKGDRIYLSIVEAYRKNGKPAKRTVKTLGYLDDLEKEYEDPIAYFQEYCREQNELRKAERQSVTIEIHPKEKIDKRTTNRKNIGSAALLCIYNAMNLEQLFRNETRKKKIGYELNAVVRLLVCERILNPGSKVKAWNNKDKYFFRTDFEERDVYRALDLLAPLRQKVISAINRYITTGLFVVMVSFYRFLSIHYQYNRIQRNPRKSPILTRLIISSLFTC